MHQASLSLAVSVRAEVVVDANVEANSACTPEIRDRHLIDRATIARPHNRESDVERIHSHLLPVDLTLPTGHVDPGDHRPVPWCLRLTLHGLPVRLTSVSGDTSTSPVSTPRVT